RAAEAFSRRPGRRVGQRHAGRQAGWRVHLHRHPARRPGGHATDDAAAAAASRLRGRRHSLYRTRAHLHAQRRHALRCQPRGRAAGRPPAPRGRGGAGACARAAHRTARHPAFGGMSRPTSRTVLAASLALLALLYLLWHRDDPHFTAALIVFVLPPLVLLAGVLRSAASAPLWSGIAALFW